MGYTASVKTSVSIPDDVLRQADRISRRLEMNRSELITQALREFIRRQVLERSLRRVYTRISEPLAPGFERAQLEACQDDERE
jgi:metal-responsive CopG/Arc/MetJ family transcriptional regulator